MAVAELNLNYRRILKVAITFCALKAEISLCSHPRSMKYKLLFQNHFALFPNHLCLLQTGKKSWFRRFQFNGPAMVQTQPEILNGCHFQHTRRSPILRVFHFSPEPLFASTQRAKSQSKSLKRFR
jgi:hypothetical protein